MPYLRIVARTCTHVIADERELDYAELLAPCLRTTRRQRS